MQRLTRICAFGLFVAAVLACKSKRLNLTDDEAAARPFALLQAVPLPRNASDDLFVLDTTFSLREQAYDPDKLATEDRSENRAYYRLVSYDAATGARRFRTTVGELLLATHKGAVNCVGWIGSKLWLAGGRDGLQARTTTGALAVNETTLRAQHPELAGGIKSAKYANAVDKILLETTDGHQLLLSGDPELVIEKPTGQVSASSLANATPPAIQSLIKRGIVGAPLRGGRAVTGELRGGRIYAKVGDVIVGDFRHVTELVFHAPSETFEWDDSSVVVIEPETKELHKISRVQLGGTPMWSIVEPEPCASTRCAQASWQATMDARRLYFFGATKIHAYDADRGTVIWATAY